MAMVRGAFTGFYPYWFVDVTTFGYARVAVNSVGFTAMFFVLGLIVVWLDRVIERRSRAASRSFHAEEPEID